MIEQNGKYCPEDKDLFCENCKRQITVDDLEKTEDGEQGCTDCISECAICGYKEFTDDMYKRLKKDGCECGPVLCCWNCATDEDLTEMLAAPVINVFEAIANCVRPLTAEEKIELGLL